MKEPKNTCPVIDENIFQMKEAWEEIRGKNIELREWGQYWVGKYDDLESEKDKEIEDLNDTVKDLEDTIWDLKTQLKELSQGESA